VNQPPFQRSVAFLAGVSQYNHISPQLDFVKNDLTELRNFLLTDGGFDTVYEVRDGNVTREVFDDYMKKKYFSGGGLVGPEDRLLVYYSGHGGAQAGTEPHLLFQKAMPNDYTKDVLDVRDIYSWAKTIAAKHLLIILDSCFSGLIAKSGPADMAGALSNALAGKRSGLLLTAGTGDEEAYAYRYSKEKNGSIFTHALIDALRRMPPTEGIVTIGQAFETAKVSVGLFQAVENRKMNPLSTQLIRNDGIGEGNFIFVNTLAKNPSLPAGLYGQGTSIAKAPDSVDPNLQLIQLEYEEVKNSDDLPALRAFVASYKGKSYGQTLVGLIEAKINRIEHPAPVPVSAPAVRQPGDVRINAKDSLPYRWIPPTPPAGFQMGCSPGDKQCFPDETPHTVKLSKGFWLGETEVTQSAYSKMTQGNNPSYFKGDDLPVDSVTWSEAKAYCDSIGGRLPTEAEWEWAARAGTTGATYGDLNDVAWYSANSGSKTHPAGKKAPNAWGLQDMLGNVWEWVADWYAPYPSGSVIDPTGPTTPTSKRVVRGGAWYDNPRDARVSNRSWLEPAVRFVNFGFRCAVELR